MSSEVALAVNVTHVVISHGALVTAHAAVSSAAAVATGATTTAATAGAATATAGAGAGAAAGAGGLSLGGVASAVAPVAVTAVALVGVAAAAVLVTYASVKGSEALAKGLVSLGDSLERERERQLRAEEAGELWREAVVQVMDRNARIAMLRGAAGPDADPDLPIPPPLDLAGRSLDQLYAWCKQTDQQLVKLERRRAGAWIVAALRRLSASAPGAGAAPSALDEGRRELTERLEALQLQRETGAPAPVPVLAVAGAGEEQEHGAIRAIVVGVLDGLEPLAGDEVMASVFQAAELATGARSLAEARRWLDELYLRARTASKEGRRRRNAAREASQYLQAVEAGLGEQERLGDAERRVVASLREVVAGRGELDGDLRSAAERLLDAARTAAKRRYLQELVRQTLVDLGYQVGDGFTTVAPSGSAASFDALRISREDWADHSVQVVIQDQTIRAMVVRDRDRDAEAEGDEASRVDTERERQWCADLTKVERHLHGEGISANVTHLVEPGSRPMPVAAPPQAEDRRSADEHATSPARQRPLPS
jgi:hypothetical protein